MPAPRYPDSVPSEPARSSRTALARVSRSRSLQFQQQPQKDRQQDALAEHAPEDALGDPPGTATDVMPAQ